tara:strand:+ start:35 stop:706 length:672 start_codon:yes stop_codon:yes gene_type:complete
MGTKIKDVVNLLSDKASLKQDVFALTKEVFCQMKEMTKMITEKIKEAPQVDTEKVRVEFEDLNEFEFQLKVGGDIVVFLMKTNVFALPANHKDYNHKYFKNDWKKGYFGQIMIYDFIADSIKFNRVDDVGYLIERIFVNYEEHFMVEGLKNIGYTYPDIARNIINDEILENLIEDAILVSIETDLVSTSFQDNFNLTIEQRRIKRGKMAGSKLGFQMATNKEL